MKSMLWLAAAALLLSGCTSDPAPTPAGDEPPGNQKMANCEDQCVFGHILTLRTTVTGTGAHVVGVPFPNGDSCIQPSEWILNSGDSMAHGQLNESDRQTVLQMTGSGDFVFESQIDVTDRPTCQTFAADTWSSHPDPADGTVDVHSTGPAYVVVEVVDGSGGCWTNTRYEGAVASGWTTLRMNGEPSMICA